MTDRLHRANHEASDIWKINFLFKKIKFIGHQSVPIPICVDIHYVDYVPEVGASGGGANAE